MLNITYYIYIIIILMNKFILNVILVRLLREIKREKKKVLSLPLKNFQCW